MSGSEIAIAHGFAFSHKCQCSNPGDTYFKGKVKLTLHTRQPTFLLKRVGNANSSGRIEQLDSILNQFGL